MLLEVGSKCSVVLDDAEYPALFILASLGKYLVYVRHLDSVMWADVVYDSENVPLREQTTPIEYGLLESPAYFRNGTGLFIKYGNNCYDIEYGYKRQIDEKVIVDKITATILT